MSKGLGATCTGTYGGDNAFNPWTGTQISHPPVVTVSQTKDLADQVVNVNWQYFTPSIGFGQLPNPGNGAGTPNSPEFYEVDIYECKGTNPVWNSDGLGDSCDEISEGSQQQATTGVPNALSGQGLPNTGGVTFAPDATGAPGWIPPSGFGGWEGPPSATGGNPGTWKGQAQFHIEIGQENSQLGCAPRTPCSLAIVPDFGGNWVRDPATDEASPTDTSQCENHTNDDPTNAGGPFQANAYDNWACGIMDRIIVPLSFAPTAANCPNRNPEFFAEGSPMMNRAMTQWQAGACSGSAPVSLSYNFSVAEEQARDAFLRGGQALSSRIDMALVTLPPDAAAAQGSSRKFTYAPLANSGVALAYYLDDSKTGQPINHVVLDPRLAAKLTTESYSLGYGCTVEPPPVNSGVGPQWPVLPNASETCDPAVAHNPETLYDDKEFLSLNKNCQPTGEPKNYVCGASDFPGDTSDSGNIREGDFFPSVPGGDSDMTYQLTDWIDANPDAAEFLAGKVDPWSMRVNSNYWNISYPTQFFQTLDLGTKYPQPLACPQNDCSGATTAVVETMNAAWNFVTGFGRIASNLLTLQPNADNNTETCPSTVAGGDCTQPDQLQITALPQETPSSRDLYSELDLGDVAAYQFPAAAMVNAAGKVVAPTQASVEAAVKDMKTNPDGITQFANESSTDPAAYPLAMVDYAMVPTCGLPSSEASAIADFLDKVATTGQKQGFLPGDLASGYYPLTSTQRAQTLKAAQEVKTQDCKSAPPDRTVSGHQHVNDTTTTPPGNRHPGSTPSPGSTTTPGKKTPSPAGTPGPGAATPRAQTAAFGQKSADSGLAGILLLLAIIAGALLLIGGPAAWAITATGKWPVVLRWLRPVQARLGAALGWLSGLVVRRA